MDDEVLKVPIPAVRFEGVTKRFPGVLAVHDVTFEIAQGECHALCGENGAGKSTLGRILAGIHSQDAGRLIVFGQEVRFTSPRDALLAGIGMVHQELSFCENLSVAENLCLGSLPARGVFVERGEMRRRAEAMLLAIGQRLDVERSVGELTVAQQQLIQIAAAVGGGARIIVFDEPTSSLSQSEADNLYELIDQLRARNVTSIYVSHRMPEIFRLCQSVSVLVDGKHVATKPTASLKEADVVQMMIGRRLEEYFPAHLQGRPAGELLRVTNFRSPGRFHDVSLSIRAGEILGFAGLVGAGRSEIAQALFGLDSRAEGEVVVNGRPVALRSASDAMKAGIGFVPEDRKRQGLVLSLGARCNTSLPILERLTRMKFVRQADERLMVRGYFDRLRVRAPEIDSVTAGLSGGNQQKLVLAKWLAADCRILILDEPTRGVDVGAKAEIHALIDALVAEGKGILLISSELPEVLNLSTRIIVLREGRIVGELPRENASQDAVLRLMAGVAA